MTYKPVKNKTQAHMVRDALLAGAKLTPLTALNSFGCFRLAPIICLMRKEGYEIDTKMVSRGNGFSFAEYSLTK